MTAQTVEQPVTSEATPEPRSATGARAAPAAHWRWILRRVASGLVVLLAVSCIVFAATVALPGDAARTILGPEATPEALDAMRGRLGLDEPVPSRYVQWLGDVVTGDLGTSLTGRTPVGEVVGDRLMNSIALFLYTAIVAVPGSIALGALLAIRRDRLVDKAGMLALLALLATPDFVVATICVILLATTVFTLLPATSLIQPGDSPFLAFEQLALPIVALSLIAAAYLARMVRASTIEILESEYVAMARLRGVPERRIIWRHAVPNALVPAVQGSALMLKYLLGGVVIVESVINYPGLGSLLRTAVTDRDVPVIQAVVLVFAAGTVLFNLVADVLTVYLTPKLRTGGAR